METFVRNNPDVILTQTLGGRYIVGYVNVNNFGSVIRNLGSSFISSAPIVLGTLQHLDAAGITQVQQQPYLDLSGRGVLIGFVDTGIDYTQQVFRYEDGTSKIQFIYDQTIQGRPPEGFYIGTEYTNAEINEALMSENPYEIVPHRDISGHGTFLASVAAARRTENYSGAAPDAEIIAVKLRKARPYYLQRYLVPDDVEDVFGSTAVMVGVEYILGKARELGRPVAICIGIGSNFGTHDGFSIYEEYLSSVSNIRGVCLCLAAGNESQARHHMEGVISAKGEQQNIDIKIGPEGGDAYITILNEASDKFSVSVRSPTGELLGRFPAIPDREIESSLILERARVTVAYYFPLEGSGGQMTVVRLIDATPGIWTINVFGDIVLRGTFHAWLPLTGFVSPETEFLSASPYTTITVPATVIGGICCGAYDSDNNILYSQSSWGPTRAPFMAPDLVAPGVGVTGYYPSGPGGMTGTSVAAAIVTGAAALLLQWGIVNGNDVAISTYQIRAYMIRGCTRSEGTVYPNPQSGYGTLNLIQTFQFMREV